MINYTTWPLGRFAYNMYESDEQYIVALEAPGFSKSDFEIEWKGDKLIVSGKPSPFLVDEQRVETIHEGIRRTPVYIAFRDEDDILSRNNTKAEYKDGILIITIPKDQQSNKKIQVV